MTTTTRTMRRWPISLASSTGPKRREKVFQEDPLGATMFGEAYRHGDDADAARVDEWWARRGL